MLLLFAAAAVCLGGVVPLLVPTPLRNAIVVVLVVVVVSLRLYVPVGTSYEAAVDGLGTFVNRRDVVAVD